VTTSGSVIKKLFSHSAIYWAGTMLSKTIGFLLIPFYTRYLEPADYGTLELLTLTVDVISLILGMQLIHAVSKYHDAYSDVDDKKAVISTATILLVILAGAVFGGLQLLAPYVSKLVFGSPDKSLYFQIIFLTAAFGIINQIPLLYLRIKDKSKYFVAITLVQLTLTITLTVYFVAFKNMSVLGVLLGNVLVSGLLCLFLLSVTFKEAGIRIKKAIAGEMVRYSIPLIPGVIGMYVLNFSDRYFLNHFSTLDQVGLYAIAYKFGYLLNTLVMSPFNLVWGPKMFEIYRMPNKNETLNNVFALVTLILVTAAFTMSIFIKETLIVMTTAKYYAAALVVPIIAAAYVFNGMTRIAMTPLYAENKTGLIGFINSSAAVICLLLNWLLIPVWGVYGASLATLLSFAYIVVAALLTSQKITDTKWSWIRPIKVICTAAVLVTVALLIETGNVWFDLFVKFVVFFSYFPILFLTGYFTQGERIAIKSGFNVIRSKLDIFSVTK